MERPNATPNRPRKNALKVPRNSVGGRLLEAMELRQLSREDLARKVFRSPQAISNWVLGRGEVRIPVILALADLLQVRAPWLAFGEGPMDAPLAQHSEVVNG